LKNNIIQEIEIVSEVSEEEEQKEIESHRSSKQ